MLTVQKHILKIHIFSSDTPSVLIRILNITIELVEGVFIFLF